MNDFDFYLREKQVRVVMPDKELAKSLIKDSKERFSKTEKLDINEFNKIIFENVYDALRNILDALLAVDGYKSYSHEASISYLKKRGVEDSIILLLDDLRFKRNSSKYYGKNVSAESTAEIIEFYKKYSKKLIKLCRLFNKEDNRSKK